MPNAAGGTGAIAAASPGIGAGAGTGSGQGNGTGTGNGTGGNGTGTANADTPCGFVEFIPVESPHYNRGTASEKIRATVHFGDGHLENELFPYPWIYPNGEQTDPWSSLNLRINPNGAVHAQLPPPGADTSRYPAVIRYILAHTTQDGITTLLDCPR